MSSRGCYVVNLLPIAKVSPEWRRAPGEVRPMIETDPQRIASETADIESLATPVLRNLSRRQPRKLNKCAGLPPKTTKTRVLRKRCGALIDTTSVPTASLSAASCSVKNSSEYSPPNCNFKSCLGVSSMSTKQVAHRSDDTPQFQALLVFYPSVRIYKIVNKIFDLLPHSSRATCRMAQRQLKP